MYRIYFITELREIINSEPDAIDIQILQRLEYRAKKQLSS